MYKGREERTERSRELRETCKGREAGGEGKEEREELFIREEGRERERG